MEVTRFSTPKGKGAFNFNGFASEFNKRSADGREILLAMYLSFLYGENIESRENIKLKTYSTSLCGLTYVLFLGPVNFDLDCT